MNTTSINRAKPDQPAFAVGNGVVADGMDLVMQDGAIKIQAGRIVKVGATHEIRREVDRFLDVKGRLILPGLLNPHQHLYATMAVGLTPVGKTDTFVQQLQNFWWRLDSALDQESTYYSAVMGIIDSIRCGVTMLFDHHASMGFVRGSLATIERAFSMAAGLKGLLCFETSDRRGPDAADTHIEENLDFWRSHTRSRNVKGALGLHANFTLGDRTLAALQAAKPADTPIHIHCGEDRADFDFCLNSGYKGPVDRLERFGLLNPHSILAHALHLSE